MGLFIFMCTKVCLLQSLGLLLVHSFSVSSLAVDGRVRRTPGTPTVVRRGQTDWAAVCCAGWSSRA